jgi:transposase
MSAKTIDRIAPGVAAIDIGSEKHFVATADQPVRAFASFTADLQKLSAYLCERQITKVAMEATGTYWMPLYDALQQKGLEVTVFNGAHARNLPGRKSDVKDCEWHAMLHSHGLLQPCFVTPELMRPLRTYVRRREELIGQGREHIQHMQRACDQMNLRLHTVISQIHGVSGLRVIKAILQGERDPQRLAELCDMRIRRKKEKEVLASLEGTWHAHHLFELQQAYDAYQFCQEQIAACDREIEAALATINAANPPAEVKGAKPMRHNVPEVDNLYGHLLRLTGGSDAQAMAGLTCNSWLKLMAELGSDLSHWQSEKHFTSWLGLAPGRSQSGHRCRRIRRARTRVGQIFRECALGLAASKNNSFGAFYRRVKAKRGTAVAIVALARKLAVMYWRIMVKGVAYVEEGVAKYEARLKAQQERYLQKLAAELGYTLTKDERETEKVAA